MQPALRCLRSCVSTCPPPMPFTGKVPHIHASCDSGLSTVALLDMRCHYSGFPVISHSELCAAWLLRGLAMWPQVLSLSKSAVACGSAQGEGQGH